MVTDETRDADNDPPPPDRGDDRSVLDMAQDLRAGRIELAAHAFRADQLASPTVIWNPNRADVRNPILGNAHTVMRAAMNAAGEVPQDFVDSEEFEGLKGWAMILDPLEGVPDYRYRFYGPNIADAYGQDLTGERTSTIGGPVSIFFRALYVAARARGAWVKSIHQPPQRIFVSAWRRLVVPLAPTPGRDPAMAPLLCFNVADNDLRAGLEALPDPVLVVDDDKRVRVANRAARLAFAQDAPMSATMTLNAFVGAPVPLPHSPEELMRRGGPKLDRVVSVRGSMIVTLAINVGATLYRDTPVYVISIRIE